MQNRSEVMHHSVTGINKTASFYDPGNHLLHESQIRWVAPLNKAWRSSLDATVRYTDSPQFDPNYWSVQNFVWRINDSSREFNFGDYYANLSQYSLNKGVKGAAFQQNFRDDQNYLRASLGTFDSQWAYLLRNDRADEPMDRYSAGIRLQRASDNWRLGLNVAHIKDRLGDPKRGAADAYSQYIPALDWEYRGEWFALSGEHAYSSTTLLPLAAPTQDTSGSAQKVMLRATLGAISIDSHVERVQPNFLTLGGSATPDRQRLFFKADARIERLWIVFGAYDAYRDNLGMTRTRTTYNLTDELGLRRMRAFGRNSLNISASYRRREVSSSDNSVQNTSNRIKLGATDRFFEVVDVRGELETIVDRNYRSTDSPAPNYLYSVGITSRHEWGKWQVNPSIDYGRQENRNLALSGFDVTQFVRLGIFGNDDRNSQLGFNHDLNTTNVRMPNGDARLNRSQIWWQTAPGWLNGGSVRFEVSDNVFKFEDSTRDYRERLGKIVFQWTLERPARKR